MLVLTRRKGESVMVGDNIEVKVLDVHAGQVKLGLQAPGNITVHRKEVYEAIQRETRTAAATPPPSPEDISKIFRKPEQEKE